MNMSNPLQQTLSQSEIEYTLKGCENNIRVDGRGLTDVRPYEVVVGSLALSNGSARVSLPGGSTDVVCSVKAEVCPILGGLGSSQGEVGEIEISVEFLGNAGVTSNFGARTMKVKHEAELSRILQKLLANAVDLKALCIVPGKWCWKLFIDLLVLSGEGNLIDCCSFAIYSALNATLIPNLTVVEKEGNITGKAKGSDDFIVDGDITNAVCPRGADNCPISITVCKISQSNHMIVDALPEEEICSSTLISVSIDKNGTICGVQKCGSGSLPASQLNQVTGIASSVSTSIFQKLIKSLKSQLAGGATMTSSSDLLQNHFDYM